MLGTGDNQTLVYLSDSSSAARCLGAGGGVEASMLVDWVSAFYCSAAEQLLDGQDRLAGALDSG